MRLVTARRRLLIVAIGLSLATGIALATAGPDAAAADQSPPAVQPLLGNEPPGLNELVQRAQPQPRGVRASGTPQARPPLAAPQR